MGICEAIYFNWKKK
jgi:putative transposase